MAPSPLDVDAAEPTAADDDQDRTAVSRLTRAGVLAVAAIGPPAAGYAAVAALLALVTATARHGQLSTAGVLGAALPGWLAVHQVPLTVDDLELGVLPLLPTVLVLILTCRVAAGAAARLRVGGLREAGLVVGVIAGAHGVCGVLAAVFQPVGPVGLDPLTAGCAPALLAALAATAGVLRRGGLLGALVARADRVALRGLAAGVFAVALLLLAGAVVLAFGLVTSIPAIGDGFGALAPAGGDVAGLLLLSIGYLPNAVIAAVSFVAGPGFALGTVSLSPLEFSGGPVPRVPLLAALPEEQAVWWPLLCLVPVAVGVVVGRRLRDVAGGPLARLRAVAVAAGVVVVAFVLLGGIAGGRLGAGALDPVTMRAGAVSLALVPAVGVAAGLVAWFGSPVPIPDDTRCVEDGEGHQGERGDQAEEPEAEPEPSRGDRTPPA